MTTPPVITLVLLLIISLANICNAAEEIKIEETLLNCSIDQNQIIHNLSIDLGIISINGREIPYHDENYEWKEYYPRDNVHYAFDPDIFNIYGGQRHAYIEQRTFYEKEPEKGWVLTNIEERPGNITQSLWVYGLYLIRHENDSWVTDSDGRVVNINATRNGFNNWNVEVIYLE